MLEQDHRLWGRMKARQIVQQAMAATAPWLRYPGLIEHLPGRIIAGFRTCTFTILHADDWSARRGLRCRGFSIIASP
jgi:hypothetical protein